MRGRMNLPVLRCNRQTRCEAGTQSQRDSVLGVGRATTGVDRHHVAKTRRGSGEIDRNLGGP